MAGARTLRFFATVVIGASGCDGSTDPGSSRDVGQQTTADTMNTGANTGDGGCTPSTQSIYEDVFLASCVQAGCHDDKAQAGGLDLSSPDIEARLVGIAAGTCAGKTLVVPGDPASSFLIEKLAGQPDCGVPMPVGTTLPLSQLQCIDAWIAALEPACETCGGDVCVDTQTDPSNCGACGSSCPSGIACAQGVCRCPSGTAACDGECVDLESNPAHCGECTNACVTDQVCLEGMCAGDCGTLTNCDGACISTMTSPIHCGGCGISCSYDEICSEGTCSCQPLDLGYESDIEPLLVQYCTSMGCHASMSPAVEDLNLTLGAGYSALVGVPSEQCDERLRVEPGAPSRSYLLDKLRGVNLCFGTKMPKSGPGPSEEEIDAIAGWICAGAAP
jgi:hypothetical protein